MLAGGFGWAALHVFPTITEILNNSLYLGLSLAAIGAVVYMATEPMARNLITTAFQTVVRGITGLFVKLDPIRVMKNHLEDMADNIDKLSRQIGQLRGQMRNLRGIIDQNKADMQRQLLQAEKAKSQHDQKELILSSRKAARLKASNEKYEKLYAQMDHLHDILTRMYTHAEIVYEDTQDQIRLREIDYKAIRTSRKAMEGARNVIADTQNKTRFEEALQALAEDISRKTGEMERFVDLSKNFMDSVDLENAVYAEDGLKMLESLESSLLDTPVSDTTGPAPDENLARDESDDNTYEDLF